MRSVETIQMQHSDAADFFADLMHARTNAHIMHLRSRSYAEHMALDELYSGLSPLIDELVETYQGRYGIVDGYPNTYTLPFSSATAFVADVLNGIDSKRSSLGVDPAIQNIVDEISGLVAKTLYKLRHLK